MHNANLIKLPKFKHFNIKYKNDNRLQVTRHENFNIETGSDEIKKVLTRYTKSTNNLLKFNPLDRFEPLISNQNTHSHFNVCKNKEDAQTIPVSPVPFDTVISKRIPLITARESQSRLF